MRFVFCVLGLAMSHSVLAAPFSFVVVGDPQTDGSHVSINWDVLPQLVEDMNSHDPVFALFAGDLVGGTGSVSGTVNQWEDFKLATGSFVGEVLPIPGNHDVYGGAGTFDAFAQTFDWLPQNDSPPGEEGVSYYVDYDNVRFVGITSDQEISNPYAVSADGLDWLDRVLSEADHADHTFVFTHHPVTFSAENNHGGTGGAFWQTLVGNDVTGVFSGHWHRYQPSQPGAGGDTWETIIGTGGGWQGFSPIRPYQQVLGFLLVEVDGATATASFYADADGDGSYDDVLDTYELASPLPPRKGLLAAYDFDDGTADDQAPPPLGVGVSGFLGGDANIGPGGASGRAVWLDGAGDYVEAGAIDDYRLALLGDLTVTTWAQVDSPSTGTWSNTFFCYGTNDFYTEDEETNYAYWLNLDGGGHLQAFWEHDNGSNESFRSTQAAPIQIGSWHHVALVRDASSSELRFYVDGAQLGAAVPFDRLPTGAGRGMLYLGSDTVDYLGSSELDGGLDEVCVFNTPLTGDQVAQIAGGMPCSEFDLDPLAIGADDWVRGESATVAIQGGSPSATVLLIGGIGGIGAGPCHPALGGSCLGIAAPVIPLGSATLDSDGTGEVTLTVPSVAPDEVFLQAVITGASVELSEPITTSVQDP